MPRKKLGVKNNPIKEKLPFLQKINIWKWLFLGLVSLLLALALVVHREKNLFDVNSLLHVL